MSFEKSKNKFLERSRFVEKNHCFNPPLLEYIIIRVI